ncbi:MAG: hypothetical protein GXO79_12340 [Chlorobi bacterium]|nr:hypothetical protein [Chlorobiota bacterium]
MKKIIILVVLVTLEFTCLNAQIYTSIIAKIAIPAASYTDVDNGAGINFNIGYTFKRSFDFNVSAENLWFNSIIDDYKIRSVKANIKYFVLQKAIKPYISFGSGYFQKNIKGPFNTNIKENGIGFIPSVGILFETKILKGLHVNTSFSYFKIYTEHQVSLISLGFGFVYYLSN